jgi:hypothetical protein
MRRIAVLSLLVLIGCSPLRTPHDRQPGTASMVFYGGHGPAIIVIVDGFPLGSLTFGEVTRFGVAPGEHALWAKSEGMFGAPVAVRLAPGEVSYFAYIVGPRSFEQVDARRFTQMVARDAERHGGM